MGDGVFVGLTFGEAADVVAAAVAAVVDVVCVVECLALG